MSKESRPVPAAEAAHDAVPYQMGPTFSGPGPRSFIIEYKITDDRPMMEAAEHGLGALRASGFDVLSWGHRPSLDSNPVMTEAAPREFNRLASEPPPVVQIAVTDGGTDNDTLYILRGDGRVFTAYLRGGPTMEPDWIEIKLPGWRNRV